MSTQRLELRFKGSRNYLQGPDIFDETMRWLGSRKAEIRDIDFSFYRLASHQLEISTEVAPVGIEPVAVCSYSVCGTKEKVYLIETDQVVLDRQPYPEEEIVSRMEINVAERRAGLRGKMEYSDIEVWVAMTKALHYKVFPQLQGKWLFVRGRFPQYARQTEAAERVLRIASSFNDKLTRSEALLDGAKVGEIYFSIV